MAIKQYEITYTNKYTGEKQVHINKNSEADARGWAESLAREENCKAVAEAVNNDGTREHIISVGHDRNSPSGGITRPLR